MNAQFVIRTGGAGDIAEVQELARRIWAATYTGILPAAQIGYMLALLYSEEMLRGQLAQGQVLLMAEWEGAPCGFAAFGPCEEDVWKLHKIYLDPALQGKGLGRQLLDEVVFRVRRNNIRVLRLNVNRQNKARQFYERQGFVVVRSEDIDLGAGYFMNDFVMERTLI